MHHRYGSVQITIDLGTGTGEIKDSIARCDVDGDGQANR